MTTLFLIFGGGLVAGFCLASMIWVLGVKKQNPEQISFWSPNEYKVVSVRRDARGVLVICLLPKHELVEEE